MNRNVTHIEDQAAEIQAEKLYPKLVTQAHLAHNVMQRCGHTVAGFEVSSSPHQVALETCVMCGLSATIHVRKSVGRDAVLILLLPPARCAANPGRPVQHTELYWIPSGSNDALDGDGDTNGL